MDNGFDSRELQGVIRNELKINLDEEVIKELIKKRKRLEKTALFIRRIVTFSLNIIILMGGWVAIVFVNLYENEI
jgi:hypothetical protein